MLTLRNNAKCVVAILLLVASAEAKTSLTPASGGFIPEAKVMAEHGAALDSLYQTALILLQQKNWYEAAIVLERIWVQEPRYRNVIEHLAYARAQTCVVAAGDPDARRDRHAVYRHGAVTMLVALPLLAYLLFAPAPRARFHAWRGDYEAAAKIHEKAVTRYLHRMALDCASAHFYRRVSRYDPRHNKLAS